MNKISIFSFMLLFVMISCSETAIEPLEHPAGGKYSQFMESLSVTLSAEEDSVIINAKDNFFYIDFLTVIENKDTIRYYPDDTGDAQTLTGNWYTIKTIYKESQSENTPWLPTAISVIVTPNSSGTDRQLEIGVIKACNGNCIKIIQRKE